MTLARKIAPYVYLLAILLVNFHACKKAFVTNYADHFCSMHGAWISIARLGGFDWWRPTWFPYQGGGLPLEYTYAPLIPVGIAALTRWFGLAPELAFHSIGGIVYCFGPATMYLFFWRSLKAPGWAFTAAMLYSLTALTTLFLPDQPFRMVDLLSARRLYLAFVWDEVPHLASLALLPIAVWMLALALEQRRFRYRIAAGASMSAMMLANMFGVVLVGIVAATVPLALERRLNPRRLFESAAIAVAAWLIVSPFIPPSLIFTAGSKAAFNGDVDRTLLSRIALAAVCGLVLLIWRMAWRIAAQWPLRWLILFSTVVAGITLLFQYAAVRIVPQPGRYKIEAELAVCFLLIFALRPVVSMLPLIVRVTAAATLSFFAWQQVGSLRQYDREIMRPINVRTTIEYRAASWVQANLPGARVMMGGSIGQWLNVFIDNSHLTGNSYATGPNEAQHRAVSAIYEDDAEISLLWLKIFGVSAVAVPGRNSPEFWKPFRNPKKFEGLLPVLWREDDTAIYAVPQPPCHDAHVMRAENIVMHKPRHGLDVDGLRRYVNAVESTTGCATIRWHGPNRFIVETHANRDDVISVPVTYFPGWRASVSGARAELSGDALGLMVVRPRCAGQCSVVLDYVGSPELWICRAASLSVMLLVLIVAQRHRIRRRGIS